MRFPDGAFVILFSTKRRICYYAPTTLADPRFVVLTGANKHVGSMVTVHLSQILSAIRCDLENGFSLLKPTSLEAVLTELEPMFTEWANIHGGDITPLLPDLSPSGLTRQHPGQN